MVYVNPEKSFIMQPSDSASVPTNRTAITSAFGAAVREARLSLGLSQESFAERVNLDRTYVSGIERGNRNPTILTLWQLAAALGIRPCELVASAEKQSAKD
jgi:transcriptional regulator with XRE-family HTH domain